MHIITDVTYKLRCVFVLGLLYMVGVYLYFLYIYEAIGKNSSTDSTEATTSISFSQVRL